MQQMLSHKLHNKSYAHNKGIKNTLECILLPARRYASTGLCDSDVSVRPSVCLSHAGIVPSRAKAGS